MLKREKNVLVIVVNGYFMYYFCSAYHILKKYDEVILTTRHCRAVLEVVVEWLTKDIKLCREVERRISKNDEIYVKLRIIGAVR